MPVSVIWMSCSAWAWVTARVTSVPAWPDEELDPLSVDAAEVPVVPAGAVPTDSTSTRVSTTRVLMVPSIWVCAPVHPGPAVIVPAELNPTVSNIATCEPATTDPATTSGRQQLTGLEVRAEHQQGHVGRDGGQRVRWHRGGGQRLAGEQPTVQRGAGRRAGRNRLLRDEDADRLHPRDGAGIGSLDVSEHPAGAD